MSIQHRANSQNFYNILMLNAFLNLCGCLWCLAESSKYFELIASNIEFFSYDCALFGLNFSLLSAGRLA